MKDKDKTQKQPTKEVAQLRRRIAELEKKNTERKQAEEALRESEEKYRTILEKIEDGYYEVDLNGNFTFFNNSMCRILRYPQEEMMGMNNRLFTDKEYAKKLFKTFNEVYRTGEPAKEFDWQIIRKDGTKRYIEVSISLQKNSSGKPIGFRGIARDVTERKQAEAALHESEQRYRGLFEGTAEGILIADLKSKKFLYANPSICNMLGYSLEEFRNLSVRDIHPSESLEYVISEFEAQARGEKSLALAIPCLRKNGTIVYADIVTSKILIDNKEFNVGFFTDITERKQAEAALRESETRFRTLFEAIPDSILVHDDEGTILHINEISAQQLEWSAKDLIGRNLREIMTSENRASIADHIRETHKAGWCRFETTYVSRSGWKIEVEVNDRPIKFGNEKAILRVARDITERKEAERALLGEKIFSEAVINSSPGLLFVIGEKGNTIQWNRNVEDVTGYSAREIAKMNILDFVAQEDKKNVADVMQEALTKGLASLEVNVLSKPGNKIHFYITGSRTKIENAICLICTGIDITERKRAERRLRESEEKYRDLVENINDILYTTDENGVITYIASAIELFSGYAPSEIIGRPFSKFVYQEDAPHIMDKFQEIVSGNAEAHEYRMVTKSGVVRWVRTSSRPFFEGTRLIGLNGILIDITERKQAEEEVKRSYEQLHETLISTVNALASTVEMRDRYTAGHQPRVTQLACAIAEKMGLPAEQIEGIRMASSLHDIGKIMIPAEILNKPGPLTELQFEMIKMHPQAGYDILKGIKFPWPVAEIVLQHHERLDGSGYPQGLSGEEIMVEARILIVANVVEAMTSHRLYRPATDIKEALAEISKGRWILYDPTVVDACVRLCAEKAFAFF